MTNAKSQITPTDVESSIVAIAADINAGGTVIFCGAGISRDSGFPVVDEFVPYALLMLSAAGDEISITESKLRDIEEIPQPIRRDALRQIIAEKLSVPGEAVAKIINGMPFEAFVETLSRNSEIDEILKIYDADGYEPSVRPNTNHALLARLVAIRKVRTIVTTNFDQLIERALEQEGQQVGRDYDVIHREEDFARVDWTQDRSRLIKIHGTIEDKQGLDVTLTQVARQDLSTARAEIIRRVFSQGEHKQVLILGYSCSDVFDLSPQIQVLAANLKQVWLVQHSDTPRIEDIAEQKEKNPFKAFAGTRLFFNTKRLVELLWKATLVEPYPDIHNAFKISPDWKAKVRAWREESERTHSETFREFTLGELFSAVCEWGAAIKRYECLIATLPSFASERPKVNQGLQAAALGNLGLALAGAGENRKAITFLNSAFKIESHLKNARGEFNALNNMGLAYNALGEYQEAIRLFGIALKIARDMGDARAEGRAQNNIGFAYVGLRWFQDALVQFDAAIGLARHAGDVAVERDALGNSGISYSGLMDYDKAVDSFLRAIEMDLNLGDPGSEARDLNNLAGAYLERGEDSLAMGPLQDALRIARRVGDRQCESDILGNMGTAQRNAGNYLEAISFFRQSLELANKIGHPRNEANALYNMGMTYRLLGDTQLAERAFAESKRIFVKLGVQA